MATDPPVGVSFGSWRITQAIPVGGIAQDTVVEITMRPSELVMTGRDGHRIGGWTYDQVSFDVNGNDNGVLLLSSTPVPMRSVDGRPSRGLRDEIVERRRTFIPWPVERETVSTTSAVTSVQADQLPAVVAQDLVTTFCPRCGTNRSSDFRYCRSCGLDLDAPFELATRPAVGDRVVPERVRDGIDCPLAHHPEAVQKVGASFASGAQVGQSIGSTSRGGYGYGAKTGLTVTSASGVQRLDEERYTALALLLHPPIEPVYHSPWGLGTWITLALLGFGDLAFSGVAGAGSNIIVYTVAMAIIVGWRMYGMVSRHNKVDRTHPGWVEAGKRWDRAFYCHKDGVVFYPGDSHAVDVRDFYHQMSLAYPG